MGRHGPLTPDIARRRALALIAEAKNGTDPATERDTARNAVTMASLADRFLTEHVADHCKPTTAEDYRRSIAARPFSCSRSRFIVETLARLQ